MRLATEQIKVETSGNIISKSFGVSVTDPEVIRMLTEKIYTDPWVFPRELLANAQDAGGVTGLVLPDRLDPVWSVTDQGPGMSLEFMGSFYTQIFHSTKRVSDEAIGGFGHGRLSALAYTDNYTVISRYIGDDGQMYEGEYTVFKGEDKVPAIALIRHEVVTGQKTGTTVMIPIKIQDVEKIIERTNYFGQYLNIPNYIKPVEYVLKNEAGGLRKDRKYGEGVRLIVGGVPYKYTNNYTMNELPIDLFFKISEVGVTLSRDSINATNEAVKLINERFESLRSYARKEATDRVSKGINMFDRQSLTKNLIKDWANDNYKVSEFLQLSASSIIVRGDILIDKFKPIVPKKSVSGYVFSIEVNNDYRFRSDPIEKKRRRAIAKEINAKIMRQEEERTFSFDPANDKQLWVSNMAQYNLFGNASRQLTNYFDPNGNRDAFKIITIPTKYVVGDAFKLQEYIYDIMEKENLNEYLVMLIVSDDTGVAQQIADRIHPKVKTVDFIPAKVPKPAVVRVARDTSLHSVTIVKKGENHTYNMKGTEIADRKDVIYLKRGDPLALLGTLQPITNYFNDIPSLKGKSVMILSEKASKSLDPSAKTFQQVFEDAIKNDYGFGYDRNEWKDAKSLPSLMDFGILKLFSAKLAVDGKQVTFGEFFENRVKDKKKFEAVYQAFDRIKKTSSPYTEQEIIDHGMPELLRSILSIAQWMKLKVDQLPTPTKLVYKMPASKTDKEIVAVSKSYLMIDAYMSCSGVARGLSLTEAEHLASYLNNF